MISRQTSEFGAHVHLHFLVLVWSFTAILGQLISLEPVELVIYRTLIASLGALALVKWYNKDWKVSRQYAIRLLILGALIACHWITFFLAARLSNISICLAGIATTSFWTSLIEPLVNKRAIRWYETLLGMVSVVGMVVVFDVVLDQYVGLLIGVLSAILAAIFMVINGQLTHKYDHNEITFYEMTGACIFSLLVLPLYSHYVSNVPINFGVSNMDMLYILILGLVCTVYAYAGGVRIMRRLSAFVVNLTINLEPVYGMVLAVLIFADTERMGSNFYLGAGIILLSVLLYPVMRKFFGNKNLAVDITR